MAKKGIKDQKSKIKNKIQGSKINSSKIKISDTKILSKSSKVLKETKETGKKTEEKINATIKVDQKAAKKAVNLTIPVYNTKGKETGEIELPSEIFGAKINNDLMAQAVRVYLANQRRGTLSTKTRGEVKGSSRKIYKQKGTGRARHGSIRAPIFVKGGVVFGPKPRDFSLDFPKKMKKAALFSALSAKAKDKELKILTLNEIEPKTKIMADILRNLNCYQKKILFVISDSKEKENIKRAGRNIKNLSIMSFNMLNTYEVLNNKGLLFLKESIESLKNYYLKKE